MHPNACDPEYDAQWAPPNFLANFSSPQRIGITPGYDRSLWGAQLPDDSTASRVWHSHGSGCSAALRFGTRYGGCSSDSDRRPRGWNLHFAACTRLLQKMLFGLSPHDASTMVLAVCVLFVTAILAGGIPAWRASRVDPMVALRYEYASPKLLLRNGGNSSCSAFRRNLLPSSSVYLSERDMRRAG